MKNAIKLPIDCSVGRRRAHEARRRRRETWMPTMQAMHFSRNLPPQKNALMQGVMGMIAKLTSKRKTP